MVFLTSRNRIRNSHGVSRFVHARRKDLCSALLRPSACGVASLALAWGTRGQEVEEQLPCHALEHKMLGFVRGNIQDIVVAKCK